MSKPRAGLWVFLALAALSWSAALQAATVRQMNLAQLVDNAGRIFRGTVLDAREGTVQVGGGELPTVTYRIRVDEAMKGSFGQVKGMTVAEIRMIGKPQTAAGTARHLNALGDLPHLQVGQDYLVIATQPSAAGLSTTVGLGQGLFRLSGKPGQELAVNLFNNQGLFLGMNKAAGVSSASGVPVSYPVLAGMIRDIVGE